jgi:hypothetical protein
MWLAMQPRFAQGFARLSPRAFTVDPAGGFALAVARGFHSSPFRHPHAALRVRLEAGRARCAAVGGALMPQRILRLALPSLSFSTSPVSTSRTTNESDASSSSSSSAGPSIFVTLPSSHSAEAAPASPTPAAGSSSLLQELHQVYSDHRWLSIGTFFAAESCSLTVSLFVASNLYESVPVLQSPMVIVALWAGAVIPSLTKPFGLMLIGPCCFALRRLFPGLSGVPWVNPDNFNLLSQLSIAKVRFVSNLVALTRDHGLTILCATRLAFFSPSAAGADCGCLADALGELAGLRCASGGLHPRRAYAGICGHGAGEENSRDFRLRLCERRARLHPHAARVHAPVSLFGA